MADTTAELKELIRKYQEGIGPHTGEKSAGFRMRAYGGEAVPAVLEAYQALREGLRRQENHVSFYPVARLANLLVELGDPRATSGLIELAHSGQEAIFENPLRLLIPKLERRADAASIAALVEVLKAFGLGRPGITILVAQTLVRMAERNPVQELAAALPLLHSGLLAPAAPLEFSPLRRRLKTALNLKNLPLAATAPLSTENLPLPTEEAISDD